MEGKEKNGKMKREMGKGRRGKKGAQNGKRGKEEGKETFKKEEKKGEMKEEEKERKRSRETLAYPKGRGAGGNYTPPPIMPFRRFVGTFEILSVHVDRQPFHIVPT